MNPIEAISDSSGRPEKICDTRYLAARARREQTLTNLQSGQPIRQAWSEAGFSESGYKKARQMHRDWAARIDELTGRGRKVSSWTGSVPEFFNHYFMHRMAWFHLLYLDELERMPLGNILMAKFPPEHGKTTMYEDYANMKLALDGEWWRGIVVSKGQGAARKIIRRVKNRMTPMGPTRQYVRDFGPFEPQFGGSNRQTQPWSADYFDVYKRANTPGEDSDERDYSLYALGVNSQIASARTDHLHVDDPQDLANLNQTETIERWFRQDALSRPGESGRTSIALTGVGEDDFGERMENDEEMIDAGILKVLKFPAILPNPETGILEPLWKERYTMENMERTQIKSKDSWDSNYMMNPRASHGKKTFTTDVVDRNKRPEMSTLDRPDADEIIYITLDPALGSKNCCMAIGVGAAGRIRIWKIREKVGLKNNDQIIDEVAWMLHWCSEANVAAVIVEAKNFQKALAREERLLKLRDKKGFELREHDTGSNKYDPNLGVPSMVGSFIRGEWDLPWAADEDTRFWIGEFCRQLFAWKPLERGNKLRQDMVMAAWFGWILWQSRRKSEVNHRQNTEQWRRQGVSSWIKDPRSALILPPGARAS